MTLLKKSLRLSFLIVYLLIIAGIMVNDAGYISQSCGSAEGANLCSNYSYFSVFVLGIILSFYGIMLYLIGNFWRLTIILATALLLLFYAGQFVVTEISDIRTYTYEIFIVSFYLWMVLFITSIVATLLFKKYKVIKITIGLTLLATVIFILYGRGGSEHINPLIGGILIELSWRAVGLGKIIWLILLIPFISIVYATLHTIIYWLIEGKFYGKEWNRVAILTITFILLAAFPIVSIFPGIALNNYDIRTTKAFIKNLIPKINTYQEKHDEYPKILSQIMPEGTPVPRLLDIYEYLAYQTEGGYYLSRDDKYCFIFQNPGKDFGYYSLTNVRDWRFDSESNSLEEKFLSICDESLRDPQEKLMAEHLGVIDPDDILANIEAQVRNIEKAQISTNVKERLKSELKELGAIDPSIYEKKPEKIEEKPGWEEKSQRVLDKLTAKNDEILSEGIEGLRERIFSAFKEEGSKSAFFKGFLDAVKNPKGEEESLHKYFPQEELDKLEQLAVSLEKKQREGTPNPEFRELFPLSAAELREIIDIIAKMPKPPVDLSGELNTVEDLRRMIEATPIDELSAGEIPPEAIKDVE